MPAMQCSEFAQILEQEPDGPLPGSAVAHLEDCSDCRLLCDDLQVVRTAAVEWGTDLPTPEGRVWIALRMQLESEGLIREVARTGWLANWFESTPRWPRLALAGAYLSSLLLAASLLSLQNDPPSVPRNPVQSSGITSPSLAAEVHQALNGNMEIVMASLSERDSSLTTSLQQNLNIVDNLIAVCEKSVREQPHNPMAREYLYGAYQQKAVLLSAAVDRSTLEGR